MSALSKGEFRRLLFFQINGKVLEGELYVSNAYKDETDRWTCDWSISYIAPELGKMHGDDPLDTLYRCVSLLEELIKGSELDGLKVWWKYENDHAGFSFEHGTHLRMGSTFQSRPHSND